MLLCYTMSGLWYDLAYCVDFTYCVPRLFVMLSYLHDRSRHGGKSVIILGCFGDVFIQSYHTRDGFLLVWSVLCLYSCFCFPLLFLSLYSYLSSSIYISLWFYFFLPFILFTSLFVLLPVFFLCLLYDTFCSYRSFPSFSPSFFLSVSLSIFVS